MAEAHLHDDGDHDIHDDDHQSHDHHDGEEQQQRKCSVIFRDAALWRRNKVMTNAAILVVSTGSWVVLQVYRISALTLLSCSAIFLLSLLFIWGTILRLLRKEGPEYLREMEIISEQQMLEGVHTCKAGSEAALKWMFELTIEGDWLHFTCTVAALLLLSYVATFFDLPTLIYIGIIMGMSVPVVYVKYGERMKRWGEMMKEQGSGLYAKVINNFKAKVLSGKAAHHHQVNKLEKKTE